MDLKLTVQQGQALLGNQTTVLVDADVYSMGRGNDNSWVLPDPKLHISNKHCVIHRKNNEFHLTDISTNGVYLNGSSDPLGRGRSQILKQGDTLTLGEYVIRVSLIGNDAYSETTIDTPTHEELDQHSVVASVVQAPQQRNVATSTLSDMVRESAATKTADNAHKIADEEAISELLNTTSSSTKGLSADPTISELLRPIAPEKAYYVPPKVAQETLRETAKVDEAALTPSDSESRAAIPDNWLDLVGSGDATPAPSSSATPTQSPVAASVTSTEACPQTTDLDASINTRDQDVAPAAETPKQRTQPYVVTPSIRPPTPSATSHSEAPETEDLFERMMAEAGLPEHLYKGKDNTDMALQIGRMLRQFAQGTIDTLATRNMVKSEFRLQQTMIRPVDNNPLKLSPSGDEALKIMLLADSTAYLPAENAIQEGFKDIQAHQLAMMSGIQGAFAHFLSRFEPQKLAQKFDARPHYNKGLLARGKTDYWREYQDYYQDICTMMEDEFQDLFSNEFGKAYESQLRKLR